MLDTTPPGRFSPVATTEEMNAELARISHDFGVSAHSSPPPPPASIRAARSGFFALRLPTLTIRQRASIFGFGAGLLAALCLAAALVAPSAGRDAEAARAQTVKPFAARVELAETPSDVAAGAIAPSELTTSSGAFPFVSSSDAIAEILREDAPPSRALAGAGVLEIDSLEPDAVARGRSLAQIAGVADRAVQRKRALADAETWAEDILRAKAPESSSLEDVRKDIGASNALADLNRPPEG